jgi:hypothetical protein
MREYGYHLFLIFGKKARYFMHNSSSRDIASMIYQVTSFWRLSLLAQYLAKVRGLVKTD